ncbi:Flap-structured DNA-binding and RNA-binding protein, partial [Rhizina undulata]
MTGTSCFRPMSSRPPPLILHSHHLISYEDMPSASQSHLLYPWPPHDTLMIPPGVKKRNPVTKIQDEAAREFILIADLAKYMNTVDEMTPLERYQEFKDVFVVTARFFQNLTESERTAVLSNLSKRMNEFQIQLFMKAVNDIAASHLMSPDIFSLDTGVNEAMLSRTNEEIAKSNASRDCEDTNRQPPSPEAPRRKTEGQTKIQAVFPDVAHVAKVAKLEAMTGDWRIRAISPLENISKENNPSPSPWTRPHNSKYNQSHGRNIGIARPGSTAVNLQLPQAPSQLRSSRKTAEQVPGNGNIQANTLTAPDPTRLQIPSGGRRPSRKSHPQIEGNSKIQTNALSEPITNRVALHHLPQYRYGDASSRITASIVSTPVAANFAKTANSDIIVNATAMNMAEFSTISNRVKKISSVVPPAINIYNEHGELVRITAPAAKASTQDTTQNGFTTLGVRSRSKLTGIVQSASGRLGGLKFTPSQAGASPASQSPQPRYGRMGQLRNIAATAAYHAQSAYGQLRGPIFRTSQAGGFPTAHSPQLNHGDLGQLRNIATAAEGYHVKSASGQFGGPPIRPTEGGGLPTAYIPQIIQGHQGHMRNIAAAEGYQSHNSNNDNRRRSQRGRTFISQLPEDPTNPLLFAHISIWLKNLRMHKYYNGLMDLDFEGLVMLDDEALQSRGVNALGARNKLLKAFQQVREAKAEGR